MGLRSILLIEDDRINSFAFKEELIRMNNTAKLIIKESAEAALEYLHAEENSIPNLVVLDLSLPKMNGIELLKIIKKDIKFKTIPIVVFTASVNPRHKVDCFNLQVAGYFIKPLDYSQLVESMLNYWTKNQFVQFVKAK